MDQLFCTACGHRIDAGDHFCTACGAQVVSSGSAATRPIAAVPTTSSSAPPVSDPTMVHPAPMAFPASASHTSVQPHAGRGRTRSRVRFWGWVAAAALFVAAVSYGIGTVTEHSDRSTASGTGGGGATAAPSPRRSPSAKASADPQAVAQARALHTLIAQSATDKQRIATAAAQLQACDHVAQAIETFQDAAASRDRLVDQAAGLEVGLLPGGGAAIADLGSALRAAAQADRAYVAWGETRHKVTVTVPGSGKAHGKGHGKKRRPPQHRRVCRGDAELEANAVRLSTASHGAKQESARAWNIVAAQFGLPTISWTDL